MNSSGASLSSSQPWNRPLKQPSFSAESYAPWKSLCRRDMMFPLAWTRKPGSSSPSGSCQAFLYGD